MAAPDDDGLLSEQSVNTLSRLATNMRGSARVSLLRTSIHNYP